MKTTLKKIQSLEDKLKAVEALMEIEMVKFIKASLTPSLRDSFEEGMASYEAMKLLSIEMSRLQEVRIQRFWKDGVFKVECRKERAGIPSGKGLRKKRKKIYT